LILLAKSPIFVSIRQVETLSGFIGSRFNLDRRGIAMLKQLMMSVCTIAVLTMGAGAGVVSYTSSTSLMGSVTNFADFNDLINTQSLTNYQEDGLELSVNRNYFSWDAPGFDGSEMYYANTGSLELVDISMVDGGDFNDLDMQISSGWASDALSDVYLWIQIYNGNQLVQEFDINSIAGAYVGLSGGGFDRVLIGSYASAENRDAHDASARNSIAIDNLRAGTMVPSPSGLSILITMGLIATRRGRGI